MAKRKARVTTKTDTSYKCSKCHDNEFILKTDSQGREVAVECSCRARRTLERALNYGNISESFRKRTFKNFEEVTEDLSKIKKECVNFVREKEYQQKSIVLTGQVGSGKTHLTIAIANELLDANVRVYFVDYRQLVTELKQSLIDRDRYGEIMRKCREADILFIDDLFKGKMTETDVNIVYEIVNYRYLNKKQMIITSEKNIYEMLEFDEGIASRIYEMAGKKVIKMPPHNHRLIK